VALPRPKDLEDAELRELVTKIEVAREDIATTLAETPERVRKNLSTTIDSLEELQGHAAVLVTRARDLGTYLDRVDLQQAKQEASDLN
jgi:hypothetical protein